MFNNKFDKERKWKERKRQGKGINVYEAREEDHRMKTRDNNNKRGAQQRKQTAPLQSSSQQ